MADAGDAGGAISADAAQLSGAVGVAVRPFGTTREGRSVRAFRLRSEDGVEAEVIEYGAALRGLWWPDRDGQPANVILGLPTVAAYEASDAYFGVVAGRYANRIRDGRITVDGTTYELTRNDRGNTLHGGTRGFDRRVWGGEAPDSATPRLVLRLTSPDGDQGFPGELDVEVAVALLAGGVLRLDFRARTDVATVVSLTSHPYFHLGGEGAGTVYDHRLTVDANAFLPVDDRLLPTGEIQPVEGTPFDLRNGRRLGDVVRAVHPQIAAIGGLDHNFVLGRSSSGGKDELWRAARLEHAPSGRWLEVHTDRPGLQVYTGNALDGTVNGSGGKAYRQGGGVALEAQNFPDAPNHAHFPSAILRPGETYRATTEHRFGTTERP